jgi:nitrate reductase delta subunit
LYIFVHIHGDSRERGMAMIDLMELYKQSNFVINKKNELPDYIPLFLEYLSLLPKNKSIYLLGEVINIIVILEKRLNIINSSYSNIFKILEEISPIKCDSKIIDKIINNFKHTETNDSSVDKEWEEPKIF